MSAQDELQKLKVDTAFHSGYTLVQHFENPMFSLWFLDSNIPVSGVIPLSSQCSDDVGEFFKSNNTDNL